MKLFSSKKSILVVIILFALILRLVSVNQSFWLDEATSGLTVRNLSYSQIINDFSPGDFHPPLYYLTLKLWSSIFGYSEIALRSLSVIFALASIYLIYLIGNLFNKRAGLTAASLLAVNGLHIYYSQEARMYSMSVFLVLVLVYLFLKTMNSQKNINWFLFSLALVFNSFTDYLPNFIVLTFWIYAFLLKPKKAWWKKFILVHAPLVVVGFFWLPIFSEQIHLGLSVRNEGSLWWNVLGRTDLKNILLIPVKFVFGRIGFYDKTLYLILSSVTLSIYALIIIKGSKKIISDKKYLLILFWLFIPLLTGALVGLVISVFSYFRLIFVLPALILILAVSVRNIHTRWRNVALVFVLAVSLIASIYYLSTQRFQREDWKGLVTYVNKTSEDLEYKVVFASDAQWEGYKYYAGSDELIIKSSNLSDGFEKLWYIRYVQDVFDPDDAVKTKIEDLGYKMKNSYDFNGIIVWEYEYSN